jgi:hypothetical protein
MSSSAAAPVKLGKRRVRETEDVEPSSKRLNLKAISEDASAAPDTPTSRDELDGPEMYEATAPHMSSSAYPEVDPSESAAEPEGQLVPGGLFADPSIVNTIVRVTNDKSHDELKRLVESGEMGHTHVKSGDEPDNLLASQAAYMDEYEDRGITEDYSNPEIALNYLANQLKTAYNVAKSSGEEDQRNFMWRLADSVAVLSNISPEYARDVREALSTKPEAAELLARINELRAEQRRQEAVAAETGQSTWETITGYLPGIPRIPQIPRMGGKKHNKKTNKKYNKKHNKKTQKHNKKHNKKTQKHNKKHNKKTQKHNKKHNKKTHKK